MERTIVASFIILCLLSTTSAIIIGTVNANEVIYINQTYGRIGDDTARSVVQTSDGGYAIAGDTRSFGDVNWDVWLVKTDAGGNHLWNQTYGGPEDDEARSLIHTSDGGYALAGSTKSFGAGSADFWLVKTDAGGNHEWNQTYGGSHEEIPWSVVHTSDGGYILAGFTDSFGAGGHDVWLVKTDAGGNHLWNQTYGGPDEEGALSMVHTSDGGYALACNTRIFGAISSSDSWLVKVDASGNKEWDHKYGGPNTEVIYSIVHTADGGYALAGLTRSFGAGANDFWLVKVDQYGVIPEFPTWIMLFAVILLSVIISIVTIIIYRRKLLKTTNH